MDVPKSDSLVSAATHKLVPIGAKCHVDNVVCVSWDSAAALGDAHDAKHCLWLVHDANNLLCRVAHGVHGVQHICRHLSVFHIERVRNGILLKHTRHNHAWHQSQSEEVREKWRNGEGERETLRHASTALIHTPQTMTLIPRSTALDEASRLEHTSCRISLQRI